MKNFLSALILFSPVILSQIHAGPASGFIPKEDPCPFRLTRPPVDTRFFVQLDETIQNLLQAEWERGCQTSEKNNSLLTAWDRFKQARDKFLPQLEKIHEPTPENFKDELAALSQKISDELISLATAVYIKLSQGRDCKGVEIFKSKTFSQKAEELFIQFMRTFYSTHEYVRNASYFIGNTLKISRDLPEFLIELREAIERERQEHQERVTENACALWSSADELICHPKKAEPTASEKTAQKKFEGLSEQEVKSQLARREGEIATLTQRNRPQDRFIEKLPPLFSSRGKLKQQLNDPDGKYLEDIFYSSVAPLLKWCALSHMWLRSSLASKQIPKAVEEKAKRKQAELFHQKHCGAFFCQEEVARNGLFHDPTAFTFKNVDAFCVSAALYRHIEAQYLTGFKKFHQGKLEGIGFSPNRMGQFCPERSKPLPPNPKAESNPKMHRLPPVQSEESRTH